MHLKKNSKTKYIVVTGGVISGLGKGIVTASIAKILQAQGFSVSAVKIDPYINLDAGTMRPTEHGEVFVTDDGGETDQDIGNYERFLNKSFTKLHNITTGQVYQTVIQKERNLEFGGKCVEVIPHIPQEVQRRIRMVAERDNADFVLVEIGGTIGDYQSVLFLEAAREMKRQDNNIVFVHVVYLPIPHNLGEMKTKPAQHSVRELMASGIQPDFIVGRSEKPIDEVRKDKLALFCNVRKEDIIAAPDVDSIYRVPLLFEEQGFTRKILQKFGIRQKNGKLAQWKELVARIDKAKKQIRIGIVGKYFDIGDFSLEDSYISVIEAIKHAAYACGAKPQISWVDSKSFEKGHKLSYLNSFQGIIVPGGFGSSGTEGKIRAIQYCREHNIPFLGLCFGMQLAVVEYARNLCGMKGANSTEIDPNTPYPVIDILPEQIDNLKTAKYGGSMRLGAYCAVLRKDSVILKLYKLTDRLREDQELIKKLVKDKTQVFRLGMLDKSKNVVLERHRHRYEVNPKYVDVLEKKGLIFSGYHVTCNHTELMEYIELPNKSFRATQGHPEFMSRLGSPSPVFYGLIKDALRFKERR